MAVKYKAKDYQYSQKTDVQDYLGSFDIDNDDIDFDNLADYDDSDYVLNANILTRIATDVDEIQDDFHEEVDEQLIEDANIFQSWIDNLAANIKIWQSGSTYKYYKNEIVKISPDDGALYICLQDCTGSQSLSTEANPNNGYWFRMYLQGVKSFDLNYRGQIIDDTTYQVNDVIWYDDVFTVKLFICISSVTYDSTDPSDDTTHWSLLYELKRDSFQIFDSIPSQSYLSSADKCSLFGVVRDDGITIDIIDAMATTDIENPVYVDIRTNSANVFYNTNNYLNNIISNLKSTYNL